MRTVSRRELLRALAVTPVGAAALRAALAAAQPAGAVPYGSGTLPAGIRSRVVSRRERHHDARARGRLRGARTRPALLLVHGFPELGYSWRKVMLPLAAAGYHVMAPDQRGYGRSGGTDVTFDDDLAPFSTLNRVRDMLALTSALGHRTLAGVVGHDFGSPVAGVVRAHASRRVPVGRDDERAVCGHGTPAVQHRQHAARSRQPPAPDMDDGLAALTPPRKHYQTYYTTREANENMWKAARRGCTRSCAPTTTRRAPTGPDNTPHPLAANTPAEFAKLPRYYVMDKDKGMAEQVATDMPTAQQIAACAWLPDRELAVYAAEYGRTGFQGGLQSYRVGRVPRLSAELHALCRTHDRRAGAVHLGQERLGRVPARRQLRSDAEDGVHEVPGCASASTGAGHWVQQEQPEQDGRAHPAVLEGTAKA